MPDLILRKSGSQFPPEKGYCLQLRYHESLGPTEYITLARVSYAQALDIIRAGAAFWLYANQGGVAEADKT